MLFDDLTCPGSEFQRVGMGQRLNVLTLVTDSKIKSDEQSSLGLGARESMENRYESSMEERV